MWRKNVKKSCEAKIWTKVCYSCSAGVQVWTFSAACAAQAQVKKHTNRYSKTIFHYEKKLLLDTDWSPAISPGSDVQQHLPGTCGKPSSCNHDTLTFLRTTWPPAWSVGDTFEPAKVATIPGVFSQRCQNFHATYKIIIHIYIP